MQQADSRPASTAATFPATGTNALRLFVVYVHGMGTVAQASIDDKKKTILPAIEKLARESGIDLPKIEWIPAPWGSHTDGDQCEFISRMKNPDWRGAGGSGRKRRVSESQRFIIESFGDAVAYTRVDGDEPLEPERARLMRDVVIKAIGSIADLEHDEVRDVPRRVVLIAESLGGIISRDVLRDMERTDSGKPAHVFAKDGENVARPRVNVDRLITLGCPVSIYALRWGLLNFKSVIRTPWTNIFYDVDVFGFPLKQIHNAYFDADNVEDCELPAKRGLLRTVINVLRRLLRCSKTALLAIDAGDGGLAHEEYHRDRRVLSAIAKRALNL